MFLYYYCAVLHMVKYSRHFSYVECNNISTRSIRSFDNLFFKFNVSHPLATGELLQKTVHVSSVTYKLYNIKLQRLPVLLNTKNYLPTLKSRNNENIVTSKIQKWASKQCCDIHNSFSIGDKHTINSRKICIIIAINYIT